MSLHSNRIAELLAVIDDVTRVFADTKEDVGLIRQITKNVNEIDEIFGQKEYNVKQLVSEITDTITKLEGATEKSVEIPIRQQLQMLTNTQTTLSKKFTELQGQVESERVLLSKLELEELELDRKRESELLKTANEVPAIGRQMKLFACVSNLKWDFDSDHIKGHVFHRNPDAIHAFDIAPEEGKSEVEIADQLWNLME